MSLRGAIIDPAGGVSLDVELDSMTCDCCQTAMALGNQGPTVFYRDRTAEEIRDIKQVSFSESGITDPVSLHDDGWQIKACPVNGPAVSGNGKNMAVAWYSGKDGNFEVKLKVSGDNGRTFNEPIIVA